jgi:phenylacetate-CoA ligase
MSASLDALETRDPGQREAALLARLPAQVARAQEAPGWAAILAGVDPRAVTSRAALAQLPVTRKSSLAALQRALPPLAGLNATGVGGLARIFMSPGPIFDPQGRGTDWWRFARPLYAAGARAGGMVHNSFSYHFTPAAFMVEGGAARIGCTVIPAGSGQTELQVEAIARLRPDTWAGPPSFLRVIMERALAAGADLSSLRRAVMGGEALPESLRAWLVAQGLPCVLQTYASADAGLIAYESQVENEVQPGMFLDEDVLVEIVHPVTGAPMAAGDIGEVVVTLFNHDYPLVRFATGDMSAVLTDATASPCGRTGTRIRGWLGRADQATKVRALFVHPAQVEAIVLRHPAIHKARLVVSGRMANDVMTLHCEVDEPHGTELAGAVAESIRAVTKLRGEVVLQARGTLPEDGKIIVDMRDYR